MKKQVDSIIDCKHTVYDQRKRTPGNFPVLSNQIKPDPQREKGIKIQR